MYGNVPPIAGIAFQFQILGEIEIQQHRPAVVGEQDVGRLHVTMKDAPRVGMGHPSASRAIIQTTAST